MSVSDFVRSCNQPEGGYINIGKFKTINLGGKFIDQSIENVAPRYMGTVVELMCRTVRLNDKCAAFRQQLKTISILGKSEEYTKAEQGRKLLANIVGLDSESIRSAFELVQRYHIVSTCIHPGNDELVIPTFDSVANAGEMIERCIRFTKRIGIKEYGYQLKSNTFLGNAECDMVSDNMLCDVKVSSYCGVTEKYSLQLFIYYLMYIKNGGDNIKYLSVYNPRYNMIWYLDLDDMSALEFINAVKGCGLLK